MNKKVLYITPVILTLLVISACSTLSLYKEETRLKNRYEPIIAQVNLERNPVIVIPGILGSKLYEPNKELKVWGTFAPGNASPRKKKNLPIIALPMAIGKPLSSLLDKVVPTKVLDEVKIKLLPGINISPKAYAQILSVLGAGGYTDADLLSQKQIINYNKEHFTCFQFAYDWRRSSVENAAELKSFIASTKKRIQEHRRKKYPNRKFKPIKFDIVAHSMGGLLTRYFLRYGDQPLPKKGLPKLTWAGTKDIDKVVIIGTPHLGSPESIINLTKGMKPAPFIARYDPIILGTMPAIYELLPRTRHGLVRDKNGKNVDIFDPKIWQKYQWGLCNKRYHDTLKYLLPDIKNPQQRIEVAVDHLAKCLHNAKQFHLALDRKLTRHPKNFQLVTWVGDSGKTLAKVSAQFRKVKPLTYSFGDGTVPRYSAVNDNRGSNIFTGKADILTPWDDINYLYRNHLGLTKDINFADNVLAFLLQQGGSVSSHKE